MTRTAQTAAGTAQTATGTYAQQQILAASPPVANGQFGNAVAISASGSTAVVGSPGGQDAQGTVEVFVRHGQSWVRQADLIARDAARRNDFGFSVAVSGNGDTVLIGAPGRDDFQGAAYVFSRVGSVWSQTQEFLPPANAPAQAQFGEHLALDSAGDTAMVGVPDMSSLFTYTRTGGSWHEGQTISGAPKTNFGGSVALSGNGLTALITQSQLDEDVIHAYVRADGSWRQQAQVSFRSQHEGGGYGGELALDQDGSCGLISDDGPATPEKVQVYCRTGSTWAVVQQISYPASNGAGTQFGQSMALNGPGRIAVIAAPYYRTNQGAVYIYTRTGATFTEQQRLTFVPQKESLFGSSVAVTSDDGVVLASAPGVGQHFQGRVAVFTRS